jgi:hypothetical protein
MDNDNIDRDNPAKNTTDADFLEAVNAVVSDRATIGYLFTAARYLERRANLGVEPERETHWSLVEKGTEPTKQEAIEWLKAADLIDLLYFLLSTKSYAADPNFLGPRT